MSISYKPCLPLCLRAPSSQIFPWLFKKMTYSNLASLLSLWHLPVYTGRPSLNDTSYYGVRMAWQNSSTGQNFIEGCANANVSSVSAVAQL